MASLSGDSSASLAVCAIEDPGTSGDANQGFEDDASGEASERKGGDGASSELDRKSVV